MRIHKAVLIAAVVSGTLLGAEEEEFAVPSSPPTPAPVSASPAVPAPVPAPAPLPESAIEHKMSPPLGMGAAPTLSVSARFETGLSGGGSVQQGFSVPSARLSVLGTAGTNLTYRFSVGQTREYSTALLPQLLPTEAFLDFTSEDHKAGDGFLRVRVGLFSPQLNPWWTPDLSDVKIPDYHETHKALFLSREMGAEITAGLYDRLEASVGYVNGSGVFTLNTNNAKAFTGCVQATLPVGSATKIRFGGGGFLFAQSTTGAINYKSSSVVDVFTEFDFTDIVLRGEVFLSRFEDSAKIIHPKGGAGSIHARLAPWVTLFGRYESSTNNPLLLGRIQHYQVGPVFDLSHVLTAYTTYSHLETGGAKENQVLVRLRLSI